MKPYIPILFLSLFLILSIACQAQNKKTDVREIELVAPEGKAIAVFASGCFWCVEHIFEAVVGVDSAVSGYAGGNVPNPSYELVNTETTGHAEAVLVYYDPSVIDYEELTKVFFTSHDPTTPNQQGPDIGSSYRSILFYMNAYEKAIAEKAKREFGASGMFKKPIVTELKMINTFYRAEEYHQDFIEKNPNQGYVRGVSIPRFEAFKRTYKGKLK